MKKRILNIAVLIIFISLFLLIKLYGDNITRHYFLTNQFSILNKIARVSTSQSLDFYLGQVEDYLWGPLKSIVSGTIFLFLALKYLKNSSKFAFAAAVFVYIIVTRPEVLFYPPYGEAIYGPFSDAIWILRHNLDYILFAQQKTFTQGGPQIYPTSIFAYALAFLMYVTKSPIVFLAVTHTIIFIFASIVVALFREILEKIFDNEISILGAILLLFLPLYQSMLEAINMEMSCLFFTFLAIYFLIERRLGLATLSAVSSMLVKAPGIIACLAVAIVGLLYLCFESNLVQKIKISLWVVIASAAAFIENYIRNQMLGKQPSFNEVRFLIGWNNFKNWPIFWFFLLLLIILLFYLINQFIVMRKKGEGLISLVRCNYISIAMFVTAGLWNVLYLNYNALLPRYKLLYWPFLLFSFIHLVLLFLKNQKAIKIFFIVLITFSLLCSYGLIYPKTTLYDEYITLISKNYERSLEYRNDLKLHLKVARDLEANYSDYTIGAPMALAYALNFTEIGYVEKKMKVMIYGMDSVHKGIENCQQLKKENIGKIIWVGVYSNRLIGDLTYPISQKDKVIKEYLLGHKKIALFLGGFAIERMRFLYNYYRSRS